jgi:hypothetical protein
MKFRIRRHEPVDFDEQREVENLRNLLSGKGMEHSTPPDERFWSSLIVRVNRRIDELTGPKALSISWAARVAIPGVVAIIFFFVGLHYYSPSPARVQTSVSDLILALSDGTLDSLVSDDSAAGNGSFSMAYTLVDVPRPSREVIADYFIASANTDDLLDMLQDDELNDVLAKLTASNHM